VSIIGFFIGAIIISLPACGVGQIIQPKSVCVELFNLYEKQPGAEISIKITPPFNLFDVQAENIHLLLNECKAFDLRIETIAIGRLYINGNIKSFHVVPNQNLIIKIYSEDSLSFSGRHFNYAEYLKILPCFSIGDLEKYKPYLTKEIYDYEKLKITFTNLDIRLHESVSEKTWVIDSLLESNFNFNQLELMELTSYHSFLSEFFFCLYEKNIETLIPTYQSLSFFSKEIAREEYYRSSLQQYVGPLTKENYLDSAKSSYWIQPS